MKAEYLRTPSAEGDIGVCRPQLGTLGRFLCEVNPPEEALTHLCQCVQLQKQRLPGAEVQKGTQNKQVTSRGWLLSVKISEQTYLLQTCSLMQLGLPLKDLSKNKQEFINP